MVSLFAADWPDLALDHVREFLAEGPTEGVTWEAKGDAPDERGKRLHPDQIRRGVCALANQVGGYFVIGATRDSPESAWSLPGIAARDAEPELWLEKVLADLYPTPRFDTHAWSVDADRRFVAVIRVQPATQTPCMTKDGQVFERVGSQSLKVNDPVRLRELISRGEQARADAEAKAERATTAFMRQPGEPGMHFAVSVATTSYEPDISSRVFTDSFLSYLKTAFARRLLGDEQPGATEWSTATIKQSLIALTSPNRDVKWRARANWDGTASIHAHLTGRAAMTLALMDEVVWPAWRLAADLVEKLGGYGDTHAYLLFTPVGLKKDLGSLYQALPGHTVVRRWTDDLVPADDDIGSVQRELERAAGLFAFEGKPSDPAP